MSRAVDVQPCFNRDVISDLSDQATSGVLELQAWAEGEKITYTPAIELENRPRSSGPDAGEIETQIDQAINAGNVDKVQQWLSKAAPEQISRIFLNTVNSAPASTQNLLCNTKVVNFNFADPINGRNALHEAATSGKIALLQDAMAQGANILAADVYGRIPLHYACMHGKVDIIKLLVARSPETVDAKDLDNFTPLIHGIVHAQAGSVQAMLDLGADVNPATGSEHIPLNLACQYGSAPIIDQILWYQPEILADAEGLFPQHIVARFGGSPEVLRMLQSHGVDMDQADKLYQWTPIFHAASEGHIHCLEELLKSEDVNAGTKDEKGLTAMYYATWEGHLHCMRCLSERVSARNAPSGQPQGMSMTGPLPAPISGGGSDTSMQDAEGIPMLSLPPPIIPLRRYGHNFLETTKTFILLSFDDLDTEAIEFYGDNKYPAARLTISSKSSDLIPRNVPLPVQDDFKNISFQIENLDAFSIDFDIFPTFGSKVIARAAASSRVFTSKRSSSGRWHLELFDPRLRAIGRISFRYQVVTPFHGIPLEITHFATYWKATSQDDNHPSNLVTGSSLSGDFIRLFVQVTRDGFPVMYNRWALPSSDNDLVSRLTLSEFTAAASNDAHEVATLRDHIISRPEEWDLSTIQRHVARSHAALTDILAILPTSLNLEIHVCYPTKQEEEASNLGPTENINAVVDSVLKAVFDHARHLREANDAPLRNFVFSSYNPDICTALNWKQPNCKSPCVVTSQEQS